jgi:molybdenum cofactor biosynthesis enzyme MoaA
MEALRLHSAHLLPEAGHLHLTLIGGGGVRREQGGEPLLEAALRQLVQILARHGVGARKDGF